LTASGDYILIPNPGQTENFSNNLERNISTQIEHQRQVMRKNIFPKPVPSHVIEQRIMDLKKERLFDYENQFNLLE